MDMSDLLKAGMGACGRVLRLLPKEGEDGIKSPREYMIKIFNEETLPSLNILHPMILNKEVSTSSLKPIDVNDADVFATTVPDRVRNDARYSMYRVPSEVTDGYEITTIKSCVPIRANGHGVGAYGSYYNEAPWNNHFGRSSSGALYATTFAGLIDYADRQLLGSVSRNFRFKFYAPNILAITNYTGPLAIAFCVKNDPNAISLDDMTFEGVRRLFILDLRKRIYNEYAFAEISTPTGNIDLGIGEWSSAETDRNELFNEYRATSHFRTSSIRS